MNRPIIFDKLNEGLIETPMPVVPGKSGTTSIFLLSAVFLLAGIYLSSFYNYLLFHSLAEGFSIVIACGVFMVAWNTRWLQAITSCCSSVSPIFLSACWI